MTLRQANRFRGGWADVGVVQEPVAGLFLDMPRPNLGKARPMIQRFCQDSSIAYQQVTILRAWATAPGYLNTVGRAARDPFRRPLVTALRPR
jgi:hypothetical protein